MTNVGSTSHWVEDVEIGLQTLYGSNHIGSTSHRVETSLNRLTIALWGHTLDRHHTGLRQVEVGLQ